MRRHNRNLENFAEAVSDLSWSEMVRVSEYISDEIHRRTEKEEPLDRDAVAQIIFDIADSIFAEAELAEQHATETP